MPPRRRSHHHAAPRDPAHAALSAYVRQQRRAAVAALAPIVGARPAAATTEAMRRLYEAEIAERRAREEAARAARRAAEDRRTWAHRRGAALEMHSTRRSTTPPTSSAAQTITGITPLDRTDTGAPAVSPSPEGTTGPSASQSLTGSTAHTSTHATPPPAEHHLPAGGAPPATSSEKTAYRLHRRASAATATLLPPPRAARVRYTGMAVLPGDELSRTSSSVVGGMATAPPAPSPPIMGEKVSITGGGVSGGANTIGEGSLPAPDEDSLLLEDLLSSYRTDLAGSGGKPPASQPAPPAPVCPMPVAGSLVNCCTTPATHTVDIARDPGSPVLPSPLLPSRLAPAETQSVPTTAGCPTNDAEEEVTHLVEVSQGGEASGAVSWAWRRRRDTGEGIDG